VVRSGGADRVRTHAGAQFRLLHLQVLSAEPAGAIAALKALAGPSANARFCPAGGISLEAGQAWLAQPNVLALDGSWIAEAWMSGDKDWAESRIEPGRSDRFAPGRRDVGSGRAR
jgi:2-keto-3-deoxy-6-phosphogluconate aldolase